MQGINDPQVHQYLVTRFPQTRVMIEEYVEGCWQRPLDFLFGIYRNGTEDLVGTVRLSEVSLYHHTAHVGICLFAKQAWHKGYASQAVNEVVRFAFETLKLRRLEAGIFIENLASVRLFQRCGFTEQYRVPDKYYWRQGQFQDVVILGLKNGSFDIKIQD